MKLLGDIMLVAMLFGVVTAGFALAVGLAWVMARVVREARNEAARRS